MGRKIWLNNPATHCAALEARFKGTRGYQRRFRCDQVLRHHQVSFTRAQLEDWEIPYHIIDQCAGQFAITLPRVYHQGFSPASSVAEAVNFADEHWSIAECLPCTENPCGPQVILVARMQMRSPLSVVLQSSGKWL